MAAFAGFEAGLFDRVGLDKSIKFLAVTPGPFVDVEVDLARIELTDGWVMPAGELHCEADYRPLNRLVVPGTAAASPSRRQAACTASASRSCVWICTMWDTWHSLWRACWLERHREMRHQ